MGAISDFVRVELVRMANMGAQLPARRLLTKNSSASTD